MKMYFSTALNEMLSGYRIARKSWNEYRFIKKSHNIVLEVDILSGLNGEWMATSEDILADDWFVVQE